MNEGSVPRHVNHLEMVHAPGERDLAVAVLKLLGGRISVSVAGSPIALDMSGELVGSFPHDNALYVSEVLPKQWTFEKALQSALDADLSLRSDSRAYIEAVKDHPQSSFHFGIRYESRRELEDRIEGLQTAAATPELRGRVEVTGVYPPGTYTDTMLQAFIWTDVFACGLLTIGQHLELQWRMDVPAIPAGAELG